LIVKIKFCKCEKHRRKAGLVIETFILCTYGCRTPESNAVSILCASIRISHEFGNGIVDFYVI